MSVALSLRPLGKALGTEATAPTVSSCTARATFGRARQRVPRVGTPPSRSTRRLVARVLFVNPTHTHGFEGIAADEAGRLIEELRDHATHERFVYYHARRVGDVVMWDEIATMHRAAGDARPEERRIMLRTIVHPF